MRSGRCKTVKDRLKTRLADILIRFVARMDRLAGPAQGFPRSSREWTAIGPREKNFCRVAVLRLHPGGRSQGQAKNRVGSGPPIFGAARSRTPGRPMARMPPQAGVHRPAAPPILYAPPNNPTPN